MIKLYFKFLIFLLIYSVIFPFISYSQNTAQKVDSIQNRAKDTVEFKLRFERGDTLKYNVSAHDSIVINYGTPLLKKRTEELKVVCDSVSQSGTFFITLEMISYMAYETYGVNKNIEVSENPWKNRQIQLEIDSNGKRISWNVEDTIHPAVASGGAFQPYLFFWFRESRKCIDETWLVSSTDELAENGLPVPLYKQSSLFRARPDIDTLNEKCSAFEYIRTGQGTITVMDASQPVKMNTVTNAFALMYISKSKGVPIYFYETDEQKLTFAVSEDDKQSGWQYSTVYYTLNDYKKLDLNALIIRKNIKQSVKPFKSKKFK